MRPKTKRAQKPGTLLPLTIAAVFLICSSLEAQQKAATNPTIRDFKKRVADFVKIHKQVEATLPVLKSTAVAQKITDHQRDLAHGITEARKAAKQGDIFSPDIAAEFRQLIEKAMQGTNGENIRASLAHSEPVNIEVGVNTSYPSNQPLQSSPPTFLRNLPKLPPELEYRIVGKALLLRDVKANLVVDFMPDAIPQVQGE